MQMLLLGKNNIIAASGAIMAEKIMTPSNGNNDPDRTNCAENLPPRYRGRQLRHNGNCFGSRSPNKYCTISHQKDTGLAMAKFPNIGSAANSVLET